MFLTFALCKKFFIYVIILIIKHIQAWYKLLKTLLSKFQPAKQYLSFKSINSPNDLNIRHSHARQHKKSFILRTKIVSYANMHWCICVQNATR